jgi:hypothetical protein
MQRKNTRSLVTILTAVAAFYFLLSAGLWAAMLQPPDTFGRIMMRVPMVAMMVLPFEPMWKTARAGKLNTGDAAPDFKLPLLDHSSEVQLSSFRGSKPVVLVFGSYT